MPEVTPVPPLDGLLLASAQFVRRAVLLGNDRLCVAGCRFLVHDEERAHGRVETAVSAQGLWWRTAMTSQVGASPGPFVPGERVVVVDGTFVGMEGSILSPEEVVARNPDARISQEARGGILCWVLLPIFGRQVPVELHAWQIRRAGETGEQA
jgi:hypothetical protein